MGAICGRGSVPHLGIRRQSVKLRTYISFKPPETLGAGLYMIVKLHRLESEAHVVKASGLATSIENFGASLHVMATMVAYQH
jgi:hypothetical protein